MMDHSSSPPNPLVSVVIPTYNRPAYLKQALLSVLHQTYSNYEVLVADDCSIENPQQLLDELQDDRIRLYRQATNRGVGVNVTHALLQTQGKYVACLNDDDLWEPDFLESLVLCLEQHPQASVAFCDYAVIDAAGGIDPEKTAEQARREGRTYLEAGLHQPFRELGLVDHAVFCASAALLRQDVIPWEEVQKAGVFWDYFMVYLACRSGHAAYYYPEKLARYRVHLQSENMLSGSRDARAKIRKGNAEVFCFETFLQDPRLHGLSGYFQRELANAHATLGIGHLRLGQTAEARPHLHRSLQQCKINPRAWAALSLSYLPQPVAAPLVNMKNLFSKYS
jgi:glycosyltransferase involved in cell wall biosynthesis